MQNGTGTGKRPPCPCRATPAPQSKAGGLRARQPPTFRGRPDVMPFCWRTPDSYPSGFYLDSPNDPGPERVPGELTVGGVGLV